MYVTASAAGVYHPGSLLATGEQEEEGEEEERQEESGQRRDGRTNISGRCKRDGQGVGLAK